jgi:hypothetical protein
MTSLRVLDLGYAEKVKSLAPIEGKLVDGYNGVADFDDDELLCDEYAELTSA